MSCHVPLQVNDKAFSAAFGPPKPGGRGAGQSSSLFGHSDELKVAPKLPNVDKTHKDILWLKLKSFYVVHKFKEEEVLASDFMDKLVQNMKLAQPLVEL